MMEKIVQYCMVFLVPTIMVHSHVLHSIVESEYKNNQQLSSDTVNTDPSYCGLGWHEFEGNCYKYFGSDREKYTWEEAKEGCKSHRAHLASIHSVDEHRFIQTIIPTYDSFSQFFPWIGAKYESNNESYEDITKDKMVSRRLIGGGFKTKLDFEESEDKDGWEWEDESEVDYWDENYFPSGSDLSNRCIAINNWAFGLWQDAACDSGHNYVCKKKYLNTKTQ